MVSKVSRSIIKDIAAKNGLCIADVHNICESSYSILRDNMASAYVKHGGGNVVYHNFPVVKICGLGTFVGSEVKIRSLSGKLFGLIKDEIELIEDKNNKDDKEGIREFVE